MRILKKLYQEKATIKPAPKSFKDKESVVDSKDVGNTNNIIEDARLKVAEERTAFEKTLKTRENTKEIQKIKKTSTVNKIEKQLIDEKRVLLKESPVVKIELKTKTRTTALDSYPDKTKKI